MAHLATLLTLADSRLPTGGHVHSGGVEEAVTSGLLTDLPTLRAFLIRRVRTTGLVTASLAACVPSSSAHGLAVVATTTQICDYVTQIAARSADISLDKTDASGKNSHVWGFQLSPISSSRRWGI